LPLLFFVIPESPRWLILNNRKEEAITILLKVNNQNMARTFY
jgi:Sugar (and other) transporter